MPQRHALHLFPALGSITRPKDICNATSLNSGFFFVTFQLLSNYRILSPHLRVFIHTHLMFFPRWLPLIAPKLYRVWHICISLSETSALRVVTGAQARKGVLPSIGTSQLHDFYPRLPYGGQPIPSDLIGWGSTSTLEPSAVL